MGEDQSCSRSGEDRISGLPDELLHDILVRLRCAHAAARTSVLSRRWRHVWAHLPELLLDLSRSGAGLASFLDTVDAALAGYSAPTLERLSISLSSNCNAIIRPGRITPWLHFAAERAVGELYLYLHVPEWFLGPEFEGVLVLPACERAQRIELSLQYAHTTWLHLQASGGLFPALTSLKICRVRMDGSDVTALVCRQFPCLRDLSLSLMLIVNFDVSVHSNSLHLLVLCVLNTKRLEVVAPRLEELTIYNQPTEAHISAPKLVKVAWQAAYDGPHVNRLVDVGRTLRRLKTSKWASSLTKRFDEVDELELEIDLSFGDVARYGSFLNETNKLPKCRSFSIVLYWKDHALVPIMLHLLRSCNGTKKFTVHLVDTRSRPVMYPCRWSCLCRLEESHKVDGIDLSSLEEVEIKGFSHSHEQMKLVEFISYNTRILKRLVIIIVMYLLAPKEVRETVRGMCHPNVKVEFYVFHEGRQVPLD